MKTLPHRGYFGIGILNPKNQDNVGTLWRSASILGASFIFTIGNRIPRQASDTTQAYRHIPFFYHNDFGEFYSRMPYDCMLVGVELDEKSVPIESYKHPNRSIYLLGAEDSGLTTEARSKCHEIIELPFGNYNVAVAGSLVMYDRYRHIKSKP
jgi:tRNA (guanosine-2'-O-)-methyltransferase